MGLFDLFDSSEFRCAAGVGLSSVGIGLGLPVAAEACTEVIEKVEEHFVAKAEASRETFRDEVCRAQDSIPSYAQLLFGPFSPITTLTVPFVKTAVCEPDRFMDVIPDLLNSALPFSGFGGILAHSLYEAIQAPKKTEETVRDFAETLVGSVMTMGAMKALRRATFKQFKHVPMRGSEEIHHHFRFREFKKISQPLRRELIEQLRNLK